MICRICANSENNQTYRIKEMMFGLRDEFTYFECSKCGCLQIADIPEDMSKYYLDNYPGLSQGRSSESIIERFLRIRSDRHVLFGTGYFGGLVGKRGADMCNVLGTVARAKPNRKTRILDVGCGSGEFLFRFSDAGIENIVGVDPYISNEVIDGKLRILKKTIQDLPDSQKFDLIIFRHSLEHISDQLATLLKATELLARDGICLVSIPVKTDFIWTQYGVHWVQIDAPRHFFIHTLKSFDHLLGAAGLSIRDVVFDSTSFVFWGSEQVKRDIPLMSESSYNRNPEASIFEPSQIIEFERWAQELNSKKQGDQASFYLVRSPK